MCSGMCGHVCRLVYRHVYRHVYRWNGPNLRRSTRSPAQSTLSSIATQCTHAAQQRSAAQRTHTAHAGNEERSSFLAFGSDWCYRAVCMWTHAWTICLDLCRPVKRLYVHTFEIVWTHMCTCVYVDMCAYTWHRHVHGHEYSPSE